MSPLPLPLSLPLPLPLPLSLPLPLLPPLRALRLFSSYSRHLGGYGGISFGRARALADRFQAPAEGKTAPVGG